MHSMGARSGLSTQCSCTSVHGALSRGAWAIIATPLPPVTLVLVLVQVHMSALGSGLAVDDTVDLFCGEGEQILQWIGYAACSRLAYKRGEVYGRYVPQAINNRDGQPLDINIVINEIFNDGDEVYTEFSNGPVPYRVRCGLSPSPATPPPPPAAKAVSIRAGPAYQYGPGTYLCGTGPPYANCSMLHVDR